MDSNIVQLAIWIGSGFLIIISGLLTWIGIMQRETKAVIFQKNNEQDQRLDKHDEKFEKVQEEIHALAVTAEKTLTMVKMKYKIKG